MPDCVSCGSYCQPKECHQFTTKVPLRDHWLTALTKDDNTKANLDIYLRNAPGRHFVCASHFPDEAYNITPTSRVLKVTAIPNSIRPLPKVYPTLTQSPPPTPLFSSSSIHLPSSAHPLPPLRLFDAPVPPCCRCCCKKETKDEMEADPNWEQPTPTVHHRPSSEYTMVTTDSLVKLLSRCNSCTSGQCHLSFVEEALALSCKCTCTSCGEVYTWSNSPVLKTANASAREKLRKVNVDVVVGSTLTAVGTSRLNHFLKSVGLNTVSKSSFHRLKTDYLLPAVSAVFTQVQEGVFARLMDRLAKGEKLHVAGDGSFDSRGYSAMWCRYFLVDAETGEALVHVLMNKKETGSSGNLEVACLEKALNILADKIGGVHLIATLVTDRHSAVIKMMKEKFPSIHHNFDPWHYFRNLTTSLLKITKPNYMALVKHFTRTLINKAYNAVVKAQGDGILASEMFRSSLLCISGIHDFSHDPSFTKFKKCTHSPTPPNYPYIKIGGAAYERLKQQVYTAKNIEEIKSVSWMLKTSTCESLNALAWRYSPKENYYDGNGHELRTMIAMMHWNELKRNEMEGTRVVTGQKPYHNKTLKKPVYRNVKSPALNVWRDAVKNKAYEIRASLTATHYATTKKQQLDKRLQQEKRDKASTPLVPHKADCHLEESDDEDYAPESPSDAQLVEDLVDLCTRLNEKDVEYNREEEDDDYCPFV